VRGSRSARAPITGQPLRADQVMFPVSQAADVAPAASSTVTLIERLPVAPAPLTRRSTA